MNTLHTAYNIIHKCGDQANDWDEWAETELHEFFQLLVMTYTPWSMVQAMIADYEEHIDTQDALLKDYDPVTGLDAFGENNKADLLDKKQCEESLQLLRQFADKYQEHIDEMDALCAVAEPED
jgi:hypothetical protein